MKKWNYIFFFLLLILSLILVAIFQLPDNNLHIVACDVGQGDAILIIHKNIKILTDGGPDNKVLSCLGRHIPFWDRSIDLVILSHPDADHSTGLIEVVKRYKVGNFLTNPVNSGTPTYELLETQVGSSGVGMVNTYADQRYRVGMMYLDILHPGTNNIDVADTKTNRNSTVYLFTYGQFKALFTGDMPKEVSGNLAKNWQEGTVNYIKIPHHGSKNGLTQDLLEKLNPKVAVISVAKDNPWNFPSGYILETLKNQNVKILRTDERGDVEIVTDGTKFWIKK